MKRISPLEPQETTRGKPLDPRTAEGSQLFGNSTGVQELLTTWCASCSAQPLLRIWYENSCEFCPKLRRRAAAAARSRPDRKPQKNRQAVLCTARAASVWQGRTMNGRTGKARARFPTAFARSKAVLAERGRFVTPLGGGGQDSHESEVRN